MLTVDGRKVVVMGFGESEDPMPDRTQYTRFRVFAGECQKCHCPGRKLLPSGPELILVCDACGDFQATSLHADDLPEITYVYWCNSSYFATDDVVLSAEDEKKIEELVAEADDYEPPHWAVMIVGGRCSSSDMCQRLKCPYLKKSQ
ncbi:MAG TPA: hypothetical protein PLK28_16850 [Candidatus Rifleibacterium sp.]|nr:hypothetical protein [Candidatus Rifleibacterium sp.]